MSNLNEDDILMFECPHCAALIMVYKQDINCAIFRHGVYKNSFLQINPHMSKETYEKEKDNIVGCGQPFKIIKPGFSIEKCSFDT